MSELITNIINYFASNSYDLFYGLIGGVVFTTTALGFAGAKFVSAVTNALSDGKITKEEVTEIVDSGKNTVVELIGLLNKKK